MLAAPLISPSHPESRPAAARYRIEVQTETVVDLSSFGGASTTILQNIVAWVSVTLADTTGGRTIHAVIDSARAESTPPVLSQASADSAKGGYLHGYTDARNRIRALKPSPNAGMVAEALGVIMNAFLPRVPSGEGGVDTSEVNSETPTQNIKINVTTTYTRGGSESVAGVQGTRYNTAFTMSTSGTLESPMGTAQVQGTGTGSGSELLGPDGLYLGGSRTANISQSLTMGAAPAAIPVAVKQAITVTYLP